MVLSAYSSASSLEVVVRRSSAVIPATMRLAAAGAGAKGELVARGRGGVRSGRRGGVGVHGERRARELRHQKSSRGRAVRRRRLDGEARGGRGRGEAAGVGGGERHGVGAGGRIR